MSGSRIHADQLESDERLVRRLLSEQFPQWADLRVTAVPTAGTENAVYRLGEAMAVRLPYRPGSDDQLEKLDRWLPKLAPHLPLAIPEALAHGAPTKAFPAAWSIVRWIDGEDWERDLAAPAWEGPPTWLHGDLVPDNLLLTDGGLHAVIDRGGLGVGDPATELLPAWSLFRGASRAAYREALGLDDATWARGRGLALSMSIVALPYYADTLPARAQRAKDVIREVLADREQEPRGGA